MKSKVNRNDPCPCGSGKKYKYCHGLKGGERKSKYPLEPGYNRCFKHRRTDHSTIWKGP